MTEWRTGDQRIIERAAWSFVWLAITTLGVNDWGQWSQWPGMGVVTPLVVLVGIVGGSLVWSLDDPTSSTMTYVSLGAAALVVALSEGAAIATRPFYTTDSAAFNQVATELLLHGKNPYTSSFAGAAQLLSYPSQYWTYTLNGGHVAQMSYPAGSFLVQAPLMALGVHHLATDWLDLAAWLATAALLFLLVPRSLRWLAPLLLLTDAFLGPLSNGGTDALFIPFLVVAMWRWDRFVGARRYSLAAWLSPVALGLACSIKQSPWFCVPFVLVGIALEARSAQVGALRTATRYALITGAVFTLINLPFFIWSPAAWLRGTLRPLLDPLVPDGQGLVTLALHGLTGGVDLRGLFVAGALAGVALLAALGVWYSQLKRTWLFLLPLVLFVPGRSLTNYLLDFVPAALIAALSVQRAARSVPGPGRAWVRRLAVAAPLGGAVLIAAVAFRSAPLVVRIDSVATSHAGQTFSSITLSVHNQSDQPVTPRFMITSGGGHPNGFWIATSPAGAARLAPGATASVTIRPSTWTWVPHRADYWLVDAYTTSPAALSTSQPRRWPYGHL